MRAVDDVGWQERSRCGNDRLGFSAGGGVVLEGLLYRKELCRKPIYLGGQLCPADG